MRSDIIHVTNGGEGSKTALSQAELVAAYKGLSRKDTLHLRLLTEEMLGMMQALTGEQEGDFWIEDEGDYEMQPFYQDRIVVVTRPDDPLQEKEGLTLADIAGEQFLLREKGAGVREQFNHICMSKKMHIVPYWESSSTTVLVNAVIAGEGIAVLPYLMVRERLEKGEIKELNVADINLSRTLYLIKYPGKYLSQAARDLAALIS